MTALLQGSVARARRNAADTLFFGGGTPSLLDPSEVAAVVQVCRERFSLDAAAEVTLETNPETVTREKLEGFRAAGVNRSVSVSNRSVTRSCDGWDDSTRPIARGSRSRRRVPLGWTTSAST